MTCSPLELTNIDFNNDSRLGYQLYDSIGLTPQQIQVLANAKKVSFDVESFERLLDFAKLKKSLRSRSTVNEKGIFFTHEGKSLTSLKELFGNENNEKIETTDDRFKYTYGQLKNENIYGFLDIQARR